MGELARRARRVIAGAALLGALVAPVTALGAGASMSPFCKTLTSFHPATPPSAKNVTAYRAWAKTYQPFFAKLAREAPDAATRRLMGDLAASLKYEAGASSQRALLGYVAAHQRAWTIGWKSFAKDVMSCVTSLY